jgi:hypothetical protein
VLAPVWGEVRQAATKNAVADIGCGDGDLAMLFARMGCAVDAVDHAESNFNQLRGVETLARELGVAVEARDIDLDQPFELPRRDSDWPCFGDAVPLEEPRSTCCSGWRSGPTGVW